MERPAPPNPPQTPRNRVAMLGAALCALAASGFLLVAPVYRGVRRIATLGPAEPVEERELVEQATLLAANGPWVLALLAAPVVLAAVPLLLRGRVGQRRSARVSAALLLTFVLLTGFSVGLLYAPSALLMVLAAVLNGRAGQSVAA